MMGSSRFLWPSGALCFFFTAQDGWNERRPLVHVASGTVVKEASHLDHDTRISILITGDLLLYFRKCSILLLQINKKWSCQCQHVRECPTEHFHMICSEKLEWKLMAGDYPANRAVSSGTSQSSSRLFGKAAASLAARGVLDLLELFHSLSLSLGSARHYRPRPASLADRAPSWPSTTAPHAPTAPPAGPA
jgi:hypothetical protein